MSTPKKAKGRKAKRPGIVEFRGKSWSYRLSFTDETGKRVHERRSGFATQGEATRELDLRLEQLKRHPSKSGGNTHLDDYLRYWLEGRRESGTMKTSSLDTASIHVERYIIPLLGSKLLKKIHPTDIQDFYKRVRVEGRTGASGKAGALSAKTVRNVGGTLHKALKDAVEIYGFIPSNPANGVTLPKWNRPELTVWDEIQVATFLAYCHETDDENLPYWRLILTTGLRRGEILGLRWRDVDLVGGTVHVVETQVVTAGGVKTETPKTRAGNRTNAIDPETVRELALLKNRQESALGIVPDLVATRLDGKPFHPQTFTRTFQATAKASGLPVMRLHDARHTSATMALQLGVPVNVVSGRLGHEKVSTTLDVYAAYLPTSDRLAADAIARALGSSSPDLERR